MADILNSYAIKLNGRPVGNYRLHKQYLIAQLLSTIVCITGLASLVLSVYANEVAYGILANSLALVCPFVLYFSYRSKDCAIVLIRMYNILGLTSVVIFAMIDSILLGEDIAVYRYCFGDLTEFCEQDKENSDKYECRDEFDSTYEDGDKSTSVTCTGEAIKGMFMAALLLNLISSCVQLVSLLISSSIRSSFYQQFMTGTEPPEDFAVRSREASVVLREGLFLRPDSEYSCIGEPYISDSHLEEIDIQIKDPLCSDLTRISGETHSHL
jgi:hypothetical protein